MDYLSSASDLTYYFLKFLLVGFIALLIAFKAISVLPKIFFSFIYEKMSQTLMDNIVQEKRDLFMEMENIKSSDEELRAQNVIRILEIGAGPGNNFRFYPKNSKLTILEPNQFFFKTLKNNKSKFEHVHLEKLVLGVAENMSEIEDNSVDALVATYVLCSVQDIEKVFKEIRRVLAPGGKYFFLEHGYGCRHFWQRWFQILINPFWRLFIGGCQVTKNTIVDIEQCKLFVNIQSKTFPVPAQASALLGHILGVSVYGTAEKSNAK